MKKNEINGSNNKMNEQYKQIFSTVIYPVILENNIKY